MIALLLSLACKQDPGPDSAPAALTPLEGEWTIRWAETLSGDCLLSDMDSRRTEDVWEIRLESTGFTLYDETGYPVGCLFVDEGFACDLGSYSTDYAEPGGTTTERIHAAINGHFVSERALEGGYETAASCTGADCEDLGSNYGRDFAYPCTSIAAFEGELTEP